MIQLSEQAQQRLDKYLGEVRFSLRGCRSVDPEDVQRDIREHIDQELQDAGAPVGLDRIDNVLQRLGSPRQWVPEDELAWWRKLVLRLRSGPEDWRLAYLSFGLLLLGSVSLLFGFKQFFFAVLLLGSCCLSRAALAMAADRDELGAQKWLIYPSLILVYAPLILLLLLWPLPVFAALGDELWEWYRDMFAGSQSAERASKDAFVICLMFLAAGIWWGLLGILARVKPNWSETLFRPFLDRLDRRAGKWLLVIGAATTLVCLVIGGVFIL